MQPTNRRLLPQDIERCLPRSDIYQVAKAMGIAKEMEHFLVKLLLNNQMWGGVVYRNGDPEPLCFGSCIFLHDWLASRLTKYPFLLCELCKDDDLQAMILNLDSVEEESDGRGLNYFGVLSGFPTDSQIVNEALKVMSDGVRQIMAGFKFKHYSRITYGKDPVFGDMTHADMRFRLFGLDEVTRFADMSDQRILDLHPVLFGISREKAQTLPGLQVEGLMGMGDRKLGLTRIQREMLRAEIEPGGLASVGDKIGRSQSGAVNIWTSIRKHFKDHPELADIVGLNNSKEPLATKIRDYVRTHRNELGVLPPLTTADIRDWDTIKKERVQRR